jgi:hypothetical protein
MAENASMNNTLTVALAVGAGFLGGLVTRYIAPPPAFAQNYAPITKEVRAQSFTLVDSSDHALGVFTTESASRAVNPYMGEPAPVRIVFVELKSERPARYANGYRPFLPVRITSMWRPRDARRLLC